MDSGMMVKVLSISQKTSDSVEVCLSLAEKQDKFLFNLARDLSDSQFVSIAEESRFSQLFMFNVHIASQILQLIIKVINGEVINFPVDVGYFYSREEALAQQKPFDRELIQKK
jgi:hypothetical protein